MIYDDIDRRVSEDITLGGTSVERIRKVFKKWYYLVKSDFEFIDVGLVCVLDRDLPGDPLWMFLVAPSGGMKSEIIRSISRYHRAYTLDSLTPQTFISGKFVTVPGSKTKDNPEGVRIPAGILQHLDGKVLVIKDFTVILGMRKENRYEIFAQLRSIYDGYWEKAFGSMLYPVRVYATIGFVAGVTPAIDDHIKVTTTLGERFLKIRQHPDSMATTARAQQNLGYEVEMRHELSGAVKSFLMNLKFDKLVEFSERQIKELILLANYVAKMRVWVRVETWQGKVININLVEPEVPTRAVKQLKKLGIGLALVRGHSEVTDDDMDTLRRVARDSCVPIRQKIAEQFIDHPDDDLTYTDLKNATGCHFTSVRIECTKMVQIGILNHDVEEIKDKQGNVIRTVNHLSLADEFRPLLAATRYNRERQMQELMESTKSNTDWLCEQPLQGAFTISHSDWDKYGAECERKKFIVKTIGSNFEMTEKGRQALQGGL